MQNNGGLDNNFRPSASGITAAAATTTTAGGASTTAAIAHQRQDKIEVQILPQVITKLHPSRLKPRGRNLVLCLIRLSHKSLRQQHQRERETTHKIIVKGVFFTSTEALYVYLMTVSVSLFFKATCCCVCLSFSRQSLFFPFLSSFVLVSNVQLVWIAR